MRDRFDREWAIVNGQDCPSENSIHLNGKQGVARLSSEGVQPPSPPGSLNFPTLNPENTGLQRNSMGRTKMVARENTYQA